MNRLLVSFIVLLSVYVSMPCPDGWRQSTVDQNTCYRVMTSKKIWFEAEAFCSSNAPGAHLTSILSAFETYSLNAIVTDTPSISSCDQLWIGANDFDQNGQFSWSNSNQFQFAKWGPGQPDLSNQCVSSQARTTGEWRTEPCGTENCFICEQKSGVQASTTSTFSSPIWTTPSTGSTAAPSSPSNSPTFMWTSSESSGLSAEDCYDWLHVYGSTTSGVYRISPPGIDPFDVYCDMDNNGGGWDGLRVDGSLEFYNKNWTDYKTGFDNGLNRNYWLGNDKLHVLSTKDANVVLRIDLWGDRRQSPDYPNPNGYWFGECQNFIVDGETNKYTMHISDNCAGNASMGGLKSYNDNRPFSTPDRDSSGCINRFFTIGSWWLSSCSDFDLNGRYVLTVSPGFGDFSWYSDTWRNPVQSQMKLRKVR